MKRPRRAVARAAAETQERSEEISVEPQTPVLPNWRRSSLNGETREDRGQRLTVQRARPRQRRRCAPPSPSPAPREDFRAGGRHCVSHLARDIAGTDERVGARPGPAPADSTRPPLVPGNVAEHPMPGLERRSRPLIRVIHPGADRRFVHPDPFALERCPKADDRVGRNRSSPSPSVACSRYRGPRTRRGS